MAAAAEATVPNQAEMLEACTFADVVWSRFTWCLLNAKERPHEQFVHLIYELGMDRLALKIANKLKVCVLGTRTRLLQNIRYLLGNCTK